MAGQDPGGSSLIMGNPYRRETGGFAPAPTDETTILLRAKVSDLLQPPMNPKLAEFWNEILADHIRNQHRKNAGLDPLVARWNRNAPERRITETMEEAA